jgi:hypothetical protein
MALVLVRGLILVVAALGGCLSIYLGFRLYRDGMASQVAGEMSHTGGWRLRLTAAGPGVFFAAFGAWLLVHVADKPMVNEVESSAVVAAPAPEAPAPAATKGAFSRPADNEAHLILAQVVQKAPAQAAPPPYVCYLRTKRTARLFDGNSLTAERLRNDLDTAAALIQNPNDPHINAAEKADCLSTLQDLSEMVGTWPIQ